MEFESAFRFHLFSKALRIFFQAIVLVGLVLFVVFAMKQSRGDTQNINVRSVTASTWGWATLMEEPVMIVVDKDSSSAVNSVTPIMQIEFEMAEGVRLTAFVNAGPTTSMDSPHPTTGNHWKKGDKVLIASVAGRQVGSGANHTMPNTIYFVIDHRSTK